MNKHANTLILVAGYVFPWALSWLVTGKAKAGVKQDVVNKELPGEAPLVPQVPATTDGLTDYEDVTQINKEIGEIPKPSPVPLTYMGSFGITRGFEGYVQVEPGDNLTKMARRTASMTVKNIAEHPNNQWLRDQMTQEEKTQFGLILNPDFSGLNSLRWSGHSLPIVYIPGATV